MKPQPNGADRIVVIHLATLRFGVAFTVTHSLTQQHDGSWVVPEQSTEAIPMHVGQGRLAHGARGP